MPRTSNLPGKPRTRGLLFCGICYLTRLTPAGKTPGKQNNETIKETLFQLTTHIFGSKLSGGSRPNYYEVLVPPEASV